MYSPVVILYTVLCTVQVLYCGCTVQVLYYDCTLRSTVQVLLCGCNLYYVVQVLHCACTVRLTAFCGYVEHDFTDQHVFRLYSTDEE